MENDSLPLYKSNPEHFRTYVLQAFEGNVLIMNGITKADEILQLQILQKTIIEDIIETSVLYRRSNRRIILTGMRRKIKKLLNADYTDYIKKIISEQIEAPIYEINRHLFEKYVLQEFSVRDRDKTIKGVTDKDRMLRIRILNCFLFEQLAQMYAEVFNRPIAAIRNEMEQKAIRIYNAYKSFLNPVNVN